MNILLVILTALQLSVISSPYDPKNGPEGAARISKTREDILQGREAMAGASSQAHPIVVDEKELLSRTRILATVRASQQSAQARGIRSALPALAIPTIAGCTRYAETPSGMRLPHSLTDNEMITAWDCGRYAIRIRRSAYGIPLDGVATEGFPRADIFAIVNHGAAKRDFFETRSGRRQVALQWIGSRHAVDIVVATDTGGDFARLYATALQTLDRTTRAL